MFARIADCAAISHGIVWRLITLYDEDFLSLDRALVSLTSFALFVVFKGVKEVSFNRFLFFRFVK